MRFVTELWCWQFVKEQTNCMIIDKNGDGAGVHRISFRKLIPQEYDEHIHDKMH